MAATYYTEYTEGATWTWASQSFIEFRRRIFDQTITGEDIEETVERIYFTTDSEKHEYHVSADAPKNRHERRKLKSMKRKGKRNVH